MLQLKREGCSYIYPPLSMARYSIIQLSELEQCRVKKLAQGFNTAAQDSNPGSRSRESEALLLYSNKTLPASLPPSLPALTSSTVMLGIEKLTRENSCWSVLGTLWPSSLFRLPAFAGELLPLRRPLIFSVSVFSLPDVCPEVAPPVAAFVTRVGSATSSGEGGAFGMKNSMVMGGVSPNVRSSSTLWSHSCHDRQRVNVPGAWRVEG